MLTSSYRFHLIPSFIHPVKLLNEREKNDILEIYKTNNAHIHTIYVDNWISHELDAKVDDIICIKLPANFVYRKVIARKIN
jgi:hypothetical protein